MAVSNLIIPPSTSTTFEIETEQSSINSGNEEKQISKTKSHSTQGPTSIQDEELTQGSQGNIKPISLRRSSRSSHVSLDDVASKDTEHVPNYTRSRRKRTGSLELQNLNESKVEEDISPKKLKKSTSKTSDLEQPPIFEDSSSTPKRLTRSSNGSSKKEPVSPSSGIQSPKQQRKSPKKDNLESSSENSQDSQLTPRKTRRSNKETETAQNLEEKDNSLDIPKRRRNAKTSYEELNSDQEFVEDLEEEEELSPKKKSKKKTASIRHSSEREKSSGRVEKPRLGEIPEIEGKKIFCQKKTGVIIGSIIRCDCCQKDFSISHFEDHCGIGQARNPYKTIFLTETHKSIHSYRNCMCCHTTETSSWNEDPCGFRCLCQSCYTKWKNGTFSQQFVTQVVELQKGIEYNKEHPSQPLVEHFANATLLPSMDFKDFTHEVFVETIVKKRQPLMLKNCTDELDQSLWSLDYLKSHYSDCELSLRYMETDDNDQAYFGILKDANKPLGWYLDNAENPNYTEDSDFDQMMVKPGKRVIMYAKDFSFGEVAPEWQKDLERIFPPFLIPHGDGDMIGCLDPPVRPIVWMAYMGAGQSRTPLHCDKLATIAFNLVTCGDGMKKWWLFAADEREKLEELIRSMGGSFLKDNFWMSPYTLENTKLKMWYCEQKKGDMIIVPPMVPHAVINEGKLSCAVAANLLPIDALTDSWESEQVNRNFNRSSIYRLKHIVHAGVNKFVDKKDVDKLKLLLKVYEAMIEQEISVKDAGLTVCKDEMNSFFVCDGCSADIFNRRYNCKKCSSYDLCVQCYDKFGYDHIHRMTPYEKISVDSMKELAQQATHLINSSTSM